MLDQLVESRNNSQENTRRSGFLLTTLVILCSILLGGWIYSLFAKDFGVSDNLELSTLVAPVPIAEEEPPPPEPEQPEKKVEQQTKQEDVTVRKENIMRLDEAPPKEPPPVSAAKPTSKERPKGNFVVDPNATNETTASRPTASRGEATGGGAPTGIARDPEPVEREEKPVAAKPPPPPPPPAPPPPAKPVSKGVINGNATSLPKPPYPPAAKAVQAQGAVNVQVQIDENGNVVSASAVSGHPLLRQAAVAAARQAKFKPTLLSGQPVKVNGIIVYNFVP